MTAFKLHRPAASLMVSLFFLLAALFLFPFDAVAANSSPQPSPFIERIYQFGDSISDTGNLLRLSGTRMFYPAYRLPYGETYFGKATGRFSDGRLIVDFIADHLRLPFVEPYLNKNAAFAHGVNFAVGGATACDEEFFTKRNITSVTGFKPPMSTQLEWFEKYLDTTYGSNRTSIERSRSFEKSLLVFGEFGGNDYAKFLREGKSSPEVIKTCVPYVVDAIIRGINRTVELGAKRILVPGPFPTGCLVSQLASGQTDSAAAYDEFGCLISLNNIGSTHDRVLRGALSLLRREVAGKGVVIVYGDYEGAFRQILRNPSLHGFDKEWLLKACCGAGGEGSNEYRYDIAKPCGTFGTDVCANPGRALQWDGVHLTDAAHRRIVHLLLTDPAVNHLLFKPHLFQNYSPI
ncbi:unnamed protein product [Cuscuta europaea]|uniref:GDSL esterase/lipase n=1 Tax=Cuscuta europaea TaxID=41803 RepID=A0A9P0ZSQ3_CUSEU|nr:unnamed protein product [Cuscuta europaea]